MSAEAGTYVPEPYPGGTMEDAFNSALADVSRETSAPDDRVPDFTEELLDANEVAESLTGFDQIAIRQHFRSTFADLAEDKLMLIRVLLYVVLRREDATGRRQGEVDKTAFQTVMDMPISEAQDRFAAQDDGVDPEDESAVAERDREFAEFVTATGLSYTVEQYMALTLGQKDALYRAVSKRR